MRIEELETILSAWHNIFSTTQLSHASERLNVAENKVIKLEAQLQQLEAKNKALFNNYNITYTKYEKLFYQLQKIREGMGKEKLQKIIWEHFFEKKSVREGAKANKLMDKHVKDTAVAIRKEVLGGVE